MVIIWLVGDVVLVNICEQRKILVFGYMVVVNVLVYIKAI